MFFTFHQNNSGGVFVRSRVVDHYVIIEAYGREDAIRRALDIGIYFNGCDTGADCPCCGDRWNKPSWYDTDKNYASLSGDEFPSIYGEPLISWETVRRPKENDVVIHFLNGNIRYTSHGWVTDNYINDETVRIDVERQSKSEADAKLNAMMSAAKSPKRKRIKK